MAPCDVYPAATSCPDTHMSSCALAFGMRCTSSLSPRSSLAAMHSVTARPWRPPTSSCPSVRQPCDKSSIDTHTTQQQGTTSKHPIELNSHFSISTTAHGSLCIATSAFGRACCRRDTPKPAHAARRPVRACSNRSAARDGVTYMNACVADKIKCGNRRFTYKAGGCPRPRHPRAAVASDTITFPHDATPHLRVRPAIDRLANRLT